MMNEIHDAYRSENGKKLPTTQARKSTRTNIKKITKFRTLGFRFDDFCDQKKLCLHRNTNHATHEK
jgi:hypothetical protein